MENDHNRKGFEPWIFEDRAHFDGLEEIHTTVAQFGTRSQIHGLECSQAT